MELTFSELEDQKHREFKTLAIFVYEMSNLLTFENSITVQFKILDHLFNSTILCMLNSYPFSASKQHGNICQE